MQAVQREIDRPGMHKTRLAGDLDDPLPAIQARLGGEIINQLNFKRLWFESRIAGVKSHSPNLVFWQALFETIHHRPADVRGGHGFQDKGIRAHNLKHLGPQHVLDIAAGSFLCGQHHFGFLIGRLLQQALFPSVEDHGDHYGKSQEDDPDPQKESALETGRPLETRLFWPRRGRL